MQDALKENTNGTSVFFEILKTLVIAFIIVIPIRIFIAQPFIVSGASMDPTFKNGDYLVVDELSYRLKEPARLDIVIFKYPKQPSKFFIKRVIGLPSETVNINEGKITINTAAGDTIELEEPYVDYSKSDSLSVTLKDNEYYVMGDNRSASSDSRVWGPLEEKYLVGKAMLRLFPISSLTIMPGKVQHN